MGSDAMFADYHLHCEFSDDSTVPLENQVERGIELGLDSICTFDHMEPTFHKID